MDANEALWVRLVNEPAPRNTVERAAYNLAEQNADDTSVERGFETFTAEWFAIFASTYESSLETMTDDQIESWGF